MSDTQKLEDLQKRLQKEKSIKDATLKLREVQESDAGKDACDATLADIAQRIFYFQNEIDKLILKQQISTSGPPRTQIPITLPNLESAPESVRANRIPRSPHTQPQTVDEDGTVMEFHGDFLSNRPLSTVGEYFYR